MKIKSPKTVKAIRKEAGPRCELCRQGWSQHVHHEPTRGSHGLDCRITLIALCEECHTRRHNDGANRDDIVRAICRREGCSAEDRQMVIDLIWRAPKGASREWFFGEASEWHASAAVLLDKTLDEAGIK